MLPERVLLTMATPFMAAYARLLVRTCHRRGVSAIGGMSAFIPIKGDADATAEAIAGVRADKDREARLGHDGTWVAHPALVEVAMDVFSRHLGTRPHQIAAASEDGSADAVTASALLAVPAGPTAVRREALLSAASVVLSYMSPWLCGVGCVPLNHLMEDAATAEISRCQLWQWSAHRTPMEGGGVVTPTTVAHALRNVAERKRRELGEDTWAAGRWGEAAHLIGRSLDAAQLDDFITVLAYPLLVEPQAAKSTRSRM